MNKWVKILLVSVLLALTFWAATFFFVYKEDRKIHGTKQQAID